MRKTIFLLAATCLLAAACRTQPVSEPVVSLDLFSCQTDADCSLIDQTLDCPACPNCEEAIDLADDKFIAANDAEYRKMIGDWQQKNCPNYGTTLGCPDCLAKYEHATYRAKCAEKKCVKFDSAENDKACTTAGGQAGFIMHDGNCYAPGENVFDTDCIVSKDGGCLLLDSNMAAIIKCLKAGGTDEKITECDSSENIICNLPNGDTCYIENLEDGACSGAFSPKVLCDRTYN